MNNKDVVSEFYQRFDCGDLDDAKNILTEDFIAHLVGISTLFNRDTFTEFGRKFGQAFPDGRHQFDFSIAEDDKVATWGTFTGTHLGNFQGLPATGKSVVIAIAHIDRLVDGKIAEHWGTGDQSGMMQQLGIVPIPGISLFYSALQHRFGLNK
jgi:steroid delta-isomerase-like uncharacterized protein